MDKRGQWNYGVGTALIIGGIYLMTIHSDTLAVVGIILIGFGVWLMAK